MELSRSTMSACWPETTLISSRRAERTSTCVCGLPPRCLPVRLVLQCGLLVGRCVPRARRYPAFPHSPDFTASKLVTSSIHRLQGGHAAAELRANYSRNCINASSRIKCSLIRIHSLFDLRCDRGDVGNLAGSDLRPTLRNSESLRCLWVCQVSRKLRMD